MATITELTKIIAPALAAVGYELLGCIFIPRGRGALLRVYIDSPTGVVIEDCERASRQISALLDVEDPISDKYTLEVSSPGTDRPLFTLDHYAKYIGHPINLKLHLPLNERRNFSGTLTALKNEIISLSCEGESYEFAFSNIQKANLNPVIG